MQLAEQVSAGEFRELARAISRLENEVADAELQPGAQNAPRVGAPLLGITGPPGAGKSTLSDQLIERWVGEGKRIAVLCIDPSSPFHNGALLGDRIRMNRWHDEPRVFIRSLSSRGHLGGLSESVPRITQFLRTLPFDLILIETVGVGQSEVAVASLADVTVVVLVPEGGDEVQGMKSGLLEIADVFVVNKSDRPDAAKFRRRLEAMTGPAFRTFRKSNEPRKVYSTVASTGEGVDELSRWIFSRFHHL